jgi:hypothetical protein
VAALLVVAVVGGPLAGAPARGETAVAGTADPVTAPMLRAGGYTDTLRPGRPHWYAVPVGPGQRLAARATFRPSGTPGCRGFAELALLTPSLTEPTSGATRRGALVDGLFATTVAARTRGPAAGGGATDETAGTWWIRVRVGPGPCAPATGAYPLRLDVTTGGGAPLPAPAAVPVRGGATAGAAPVLGGGPVNAGLAPGERRWWGFDARAGTEARATVVLGGAPAAAASCPAVVRTELRGPGLRPVDAATVAFDGREPVGRHVGSGRITAERAGRWYLAVSLDRAGCAPLPVRIEVRDLAAPQPVPGGAVRGSGNPVGVLAALLGSAVAVTVLPLLVLFLAVGRSRPKRAPAAPRPAPAAPRPAPAAPRPAPPRPPPLPRVDDGLYHRPPDRPGTRDVR